MQLPQQEARYENCDNNNYTSHRRHTNFFHIKRVYGCVTLGFGYLFTFEQVDEIFTEDS